VRASAPLGDVKLGVEEEDGSRYEYALALPCIGRPVSPDRIDEALWARARVPLEWMSPAEGSTDEDGRLDSAQVRSLYLDATSRPHKAVRIDLDDVDLLDVRVVPDEEEAP